MDSIHFAEIIRDLRSPRRLQEKRMRMQDKTVQKFFLRAMPTF
jgi:hypothetical protein